jgi:DNA-binding GntR family transcriptional regulator
MPIIGVVGYLVQYLRDEIIMGGLSPGEKINEIHVSQGLNVSRPPLREALRKLENEQFIVSAPRRGSYVAGISHEDLKEIYGIREMIECEAIDLLKEKKLTKLPEIEAISDRISRSNVPSLEDAPKKFLDYIKERLDFHVRLVEAGGNRRLFEIYQGIRFNLLRYHFFSKSKRLIDSPNKSEKEHAQILKFISDRKYGKAKISLKAHIRSHQEIILSEIEKIEKMKTSKNI